MQNRDEINMKIGSRIKDLLKENGMKQKDLMEPLHCSLQNINNFINRGQKLTQYQEDVLCEIFGVSLDYLRCRTDYRSIDEEKEAANINRKFVRLADKKIAECVMRIVELKGYYFSEDSYDNIKLTRSTDSKEFYSRIDAEIFSEFIEDVSSYINHKLEMMFTKYGEDYTSGEIYLHTKEGNIRLSDVLEEEFSKNGEISKKEISEYIGRKLR